MPKFYISNRNKLVLLIPFLYSFFSRGASLRDFTVNAVTSWIPGIILIFSLCSIGFAESIVLFFLGYIAFICVYEIGYLVNDSFSLHNDATPRRRLDISFGCWFVVSFLLTRAATFLLIVYGSAAASSNLFWFSYGALVVVIASHNLLIRVELKFLTFLQLSLFRFSLPVFIALIEQSLEPLFSLVILTGLILFTYPRFLTYLDAKGRLSIRERKNEGFLLASHLIGFPFLAVVSVLFESSAPLAVWIWVTGVQAFYFIGRRFNFLQSFKHSVSLDGK